MGTVVDSALLSTGALMKIRLLLIEDNRLLREGLTAMLGEQPEFEVAAEAWDGKAALFRLQDWKPEIVLLDMGVRNHNRIQFVEFARERRPGVKVIVKNLGGSEADLVELVRAGASGFVLNDATFQDVLEAIRTVASGASVLPSALTSELFSQIVKRRVTDATPAIPQSVRMTKREKEIVALIAAGLSNKDIAHRLNIATYTVKSHVHSILEKLALHTRLEIAVYVQGSAPLTAEGLSSGSRR